MLDSVAREEALCMSKDRALWEERTNTERRGCACGFEEPGGDSCGWSGLSKGGGGEVTKA